MRLLSKEIFGIRNAFYTKKILYQKCNDILFLDGHYIIASNNGKLLITSNCSDYTQIVLANSSEEFIKVIEFNNKCVAIGQGGIIAIIDCNDLLSATFIQLDATSLYDIATDGTKVVISGNDCKAFVSEDLENWETKLIDPNVATSTTVNYWSHILFDGSQFVVGQSSYSTTNRFYIKKSTDLENWGNVITVQDYILKFYYCDGKYFLFKTTGYRYTTDFVNYSNFVFTRGIPKKCVCYDNKLYIVCSDASSLDPSVQSCIDVVKLSNLNSISEIINISGFRALSMCINNEKLVCCGDDIPYDNNNGYVSYRYNGN